MASALSAVHLLNIDQLAAVIKNRIDKVLIIDSRSFLEFNTCHILNAVNVCCSKIVKRRLQQDKISVREFLVHTCQIEADDSYDVIVYDQGSEDVSLLSPDSFVYVLLKKLSEVFKSVSLLQGGFLEYQGRYPALCEDKTRKCPSLTSLSQPCMSISNLGPTRILPFLYLGSQNDAMNKELLKDHNITYELNVSTTCPKPDFIQDHQFLRISVNDNYSEKLLPHFPKAFNFLDKVQESNGCVLVHCLAGISRSPTIAIAYVMRHLNMTSEEGYRYVKAKRATISPNFNFLGQLLEYEKQLKAENVLRRSSDATLAPVIANGNKRQCLTDMRKSARSLTLTLPTSAPTTAARSPGFVPSPFSPCPSDLSPTTGISKLSFVTDEKDASLDDVPTKELQAVRWERLGKTGVLGFQEQKSSVSRTFKTQLTFMTSVKEESSGSKMSFCSSSSSTSSSYLFSKSRVESTMQMAPHTEYRAQPISSPPSFTTFLHTVPCSRHQDLSPSNSGSVCSSHEATPDRETEESLLSSSSSSRRAWSLPPLRAGEKRPCSSADTASCGQSSDVGDGIESLTSSQCTTCSMSGSWNALPDDNHPHYFRSNSNSTSGIGSEVSDLDPLTECGGQVQEQGCCGGSETKLGATMSSPTESGMIVDNVHVALRKPLQLMPSSRSRNSLPKSVRDSGNPQSPLENFPADEGTTELFPFWDRSGNMAKKAHDSGILASPTWSGPSNLEFSVKCSEEGYFSEQTKSSSSAFVSLEKAATGSGKSGSDPLKPSVSTTVLSEKVTAGIEVEKNTSLTCHVSSSRQGQLPSSRQDPKSSSSRVMVEQLFDKLQKSQVKDLCSSSSVGKKDDGLYRAQSCPGIMAPFQCTTASVESCPTAASLLTSGPRLRGLHFTSMERAEKFRNRYSCGSLDYGDLGRFLFDSCPDFGHFGRCQSSGAIATVADRTPVTPPHRAFTRNISIIQVS